MEITVFDWKVCLIAFFIGILIGLLVGYSIGIVPNLKYQQSAIETCYYANNLTELINLQSKTMDLYTGCNHTMLNKLNCDLIGG